MKLKWQAGALALAGAVWLLPGTAQAVGAALWLPIHDGSSWTFQRTGQWVRSDGSSGSEGPVVEQIRFSAINQVLGGHQADWLGSNGWYLRETAQGYDMVYELRASRPGWYRSYTDPQPFLSKTVLDIGQSQHSSGAWQGQSEDGVGGWQAWTGSWEQTLSYLGLESVSTPLGSFQAMKFSSFEASDKTVGGPHLDHAHWTDIFWLVDGVGIVKVMGSGRNATDFNGDGVFDWWSDETQTLLAVPEPGSGSLLAAGLFAGLFLRAGAKRRGCQPPR